METVKILHTGDIHIGAEESFLGEKAELRRRETLLTFEKIIDLGAENRVDLILIAGDLFHSNNVESSFVDAVLSKIRLCSVPVLYAAGNHDPLNASSPFKKHQIPENLYIFNTDETVFTFEDLGVKVFGRSFESSFLSGKNKPDLKGVEGYINISLLHGELTTDLNSPYNAVTKEYISASNMDYIALGHIHKRSNIGKIGDTFFAYCGCPEGQGFDELDEKGVYIGNIGKNFCDLQFVPTSKRRHIEEKIDISLCNDAVKTVLETLEAKFGEKYGDHLYKIKFFGELEESGSLDIADIAARLSEKLYFVKVSDYTDRKTDLEALSKEKTLKGIFVKKMLENLENAEEKEKYKKALKIGLSAFSGEVKLDEN